MNKKILLKFAKSLRNIDGNRNLFAKNLWGSQLKETERLRLLCFKRYFIDNFLKTLFVLNWNYCLFFLYPSWVEITDEFTIYKVLFRNILYEKTATICFHRNLARCFFYWNLLHYRLASGCLELHFNYFWRRIYNKNNFIQSRVLKKFVFNWYNTRIFLKWSCKMGF